MGMLMLVLSLLSLFIGGALGRTLTFAVLQSITSNSRLAEAADPGS